MSILKIAVSLMDNAKVHRQWIFLPTISADFGCGPKQVFWLIVFFPEILAKYSLAGSRRLLERVADHCSDPSVDFNSRNIFPDFWAAVWTQHCCKSGSSLAREKQKQKINKNKITAINRWKDFSSLSSSFPVIVHASRMGHVCFSAYDDRNKSTFNIFERVAPKCSLGGSFHRSHHTKTKFNLLEETRNWHWKTYSCRIGVCTSTTSLFQPIRTGSKHRWLKWKQNKETKFCRLRLTLWQSNLHKDPQKTSKSLYHSNFSWDRQCSTILSDIIPRKKRGKWYSDQFPQSWM